MPNWAFNTLTVRGEKHHIKAFLAETISSDRRLDFEKIIPYPDGFDHELVSPRPGKSYLANDPVQQAGRVANAKARYEAGELFPEMRAKYATWDELQAAYDRNAALGGETWYDWNVAHWGTKWNACECEFDADLERQEGEVTIEIRFDTAWSAPLPVFDALARNFPWLRIEFVTRYEGEEDISGRCYNADYADHQDAAITTNGQEA
jgi:hypothetical protein